jgi:hypothetical protein
MTNAEQSDGTARIVIHSLNWAFESGKWEGKMLAWRNQDGESRWGI